jgi:hypothetical protein
MQVTLLGAQAGHNANTRYAAFTSGANGPKANPAVETVSLTNGVSIQNSPTGVALHSAQTSLHTYDATVSGNTVRIDVSGGSASVNNSTITGNAQLILTGELYAAVAAVAVSGNGNLTTKSNRIAFDLQVGGNGDVYVG